MAAQTTYTASPVVGVPGMLYDMMPSVDIWSSAWGNATGCDVGDFATYLAAETVELPDAAADVTTNGRGFVIYQPYRASAQIARYEQVSLLRRGRIWLLCVDAIAANVPVHVRRDGTNNGKLYASATGASLLPGIKCLIGAGAGGTGLFEVDLTQT